MLGSLATQGIWRWAQRLLVSLVAVADDTALDTRLRVPLSELRAVVEDHEVAAFDRVLKELVSAQLLVMDGDAQTATVEVAHEALIRKWPRLPGPGWLKTGGTSDAASRACGGAGVAGAERRRVAAVSRAAAEAQAQEWRQTWNPASGP